MVKFGIFTIFIAELVVFTNIILLIVKIDNTVNKINKSVLNIGVNIRVIFQDIMSLMQDFVNEVTVIKSRIEERKYEYSKKILKTLIFYLSLILLRGNYKKAFVLYSLFKDIYDGYKTGINLTT